MMEIVLHYVPERRPMGPVLDELCRLFTPCDTLSIRGMMSSTMVITDKRRAAEDITNADDNDNYEGGTERGQNVDSSDAIDSTDRNEFEEENAIIIVF